MGLCAAVLARDVRRENRNSSSTPRKQPEDKEKQRWKPLRSWKKKASANKTIFGICMSTDSEERARGRRKKEEKERNREWRTRREGEKTARLVIHWMDLKPNETCTEVQVQTARSPAERHTLSDWSEYREHTARQKMRGNCSRNGKNRLQGGGWRREEEEERSC